MAQDYTLNGYSIRYFLGEEKLSRLTKKVNKFVKANKHLEFATVNIGWEGEDIGWTAHVIYMGTANEV